MSLTVLLVLASFAYGAAQGSFAGVVAERVPAGRSINGHSVCGCGRRLRAGENIPVLGWLRTRGQAACCGASVPIRYLFAEVGLGAVWAGLAITSPPWPLAAAVATVAFALLLATLWDRPAPLDATSGAGLS